MPEVTKEMLALYREMSRISEQEYCAGWVDGLERSLWAGLESYPRLQRLSEACDGWIAWIDRHGSPYANVDVFYNVKFLEESSKGPAWISTKDWLDLNKPEEDKIMPSFWPCGIVVPVASPMQILGEARSQWEEQSTSMLSLEFRPSEDMIEVLAVSSNGNREQSLFWVEQVQGFPYPCSIACEMEDRFDCITQGDFRAALEAAMNWSHVRSSVLNMLIWIEGEI